MVTTVYKKRKRKKTKHGQETEGREGEAEKENGFIPESNAEV